MADLRHTSGRWFPACREVNGDRRHFVEAADGDGPICDVSGFLAPAALLRPPEEEEANALRIAVCVNACNGIATTDLMRGVVRDLIVGNENALWWLHELGKATDLMNRFPSEVQKKLARTVAELAGNVRSATGSNETVEQIAARVLAEARAAEARRKEAPYG